MVDIARTLVVGGTSARKVPCQSADKLLPAKRKIVSFLKSARSYTARKTQSKASVRNADTIFDDFVLYTMHSDWRQFPPELAYISAEPPPGFAYTLWGFIYEINYRRRCPTAVVSKSRGTWESAVQHLSLRLLYGIHGAKK